MVALIRKVLDYPKLYWKKHQFMKNSEMGGVPILGKAPTV